MIGSDREVIRSALEIYHPAVGLIYFAAVVIGAMFFFNPLYIFSGLLCAFASGIMICGARRIVKVIIFTLPLFILIALLNPLVNHGGITPLFYIGGNAFTLEALAYGLCSGAVLLLVVTWFLSYNRVVTPERFLFLFGAFAPAAALLVTMTQRMIVLFTRRARMIGEAQKTLLCDPSHGGFKSRLENGLRATGILLTWSMEDGLDTADSMKARGYGAARRTNFSIYRFRLQDALTVVLIIALFATSLLGYLTLGQFRCYPSLSLPLLSEWGACSLGAYLALGLLLPLAELLEVVKWRF